MAATAMNVNVPLPDEEEQLLAKFVFGDTTDLQENLAKFNADFIFNEQEMDIEDQEDEGSNSDEDDAAQNGNLDQVNDDQLFFVDDGENEDTEDAMDIDDESDSSSDLYSEDGDVAWVDSDDEKVKVPILTTNKTKKLRTSYNESIINGTHYINRLRSQFEKIYPRPKWVDDESDSEIDNEEEDDEEGTNVIDGNINTLTKILSTTYNYKDTLSTSKLLPPKKLDILRLKDANASHASHSAIQSLSFHPSKPLLLTGGYDKTLRIYHIDGKTNHLVTSLHLVGSPIQTCTFYTTLSNQNEQKIFTAGRRRYMHSWDLSLENLTHTQTAKIEKFSRLYGHESTQRSFENFKMAHLQNVKTNSVHGVILLQGNNGWINILHATSGLWIMGCKIEGVITDFCIDYQLISHNKFKTILIAVNTYGEVWEFDLNMNGHVISRWKDQGGMGITKIQVGGGTTDISPARQISKIKPNRWLAVGSESGFVNLYDRNNTMNSSTPTPVAALDQLTTSISNLQFSPDGQILCMASRAVKDALRLVHLPSCTVFSNWPTSGTPLGKVTSVTFSPSGELLAVGNEQGKVRLWRLNHY
ncbi:utp18p [Saccharomyces arboricola H-6]|uniref:Utp18p n=1 Tax=Saccharomyces arboricola (strain H-6 / AS 2.3317 / CBS 10644) TaxID=1160507 RepID=J8Q6E9_SACAR|nr:utp18p [Saccharomyces arboricola H-6]